MPRPHRVSGIPLPGLERAPAGAVHRGRVLRRLVVAILTAGALLAGLAMPWLGGLARAANLGGSLLQPVDAELLGRTATGNTRILAADGSLITELYRRNRIPVASDAIAPVMKHAIVAIEDARFFEHGAVDGQGLLRALVANISAGTVVEGGSTLSQQLVKQIRLQTADTAEEREEATAETLGRKLREAQLALGLEDRYSKDEILTRYLNRVYFGAGAYGVGAAAHTYFGVTPDQLTAAQAATLAGLVQSPTRYDPFVAPDRATARRDVVIGAMLEQGFMNQAAADEARSHPVQLSPGQGPPRGCRQALIGGFFCDYVLDYLAGTLGLSREQLRTGGLTIETTLDPAIQHAGDAAVVATLAMGDPRAGIFTAVEPGTGRVLAMSVNRTFGVGDPSKTTVNLNVVAGQGSGSTYKVFTAAAALEKGFGTQFTRTTSDPYISHVYLDGDGPYTVQNAGHYPRTLTLEKALYMSSNTYFLALEDALGSVAGPVSMAQRMGLFSIDPVAEQIVAENRGSFTYGAEATSPLALASAYATLAASGTQCDPTPVVAILDRSGEPLAPEDGGALPPEERCTPEAIPAGIANTLTQVLREDVEPGHPGQTARRAYVPGHQIAGKTGTTQNNYSVAFVGYTPRITASVMVYDPVENRDVGGFGGGKAAQIWHDALTPVLASRPMVPFPPADPEYVSGHFRSVPRGCTGVSESRCASLLAAADLTARMVPADSARPPGVVLGVEPSPGSIVEAGSAVAVRISNGSRWVPPPPPEPQPQPEAKPEPVAKPEREPQPDPQTRPRTAPGAGVQPPVPGAVSDGAQ